MFYRSCVVDFDMDIALESLLFVSTHFIINTQLYCCIWNASTLKQLSGSLTEEITKSNTLFFVFRRYIFILSCWYQNRNVRPVKSSLFLRFEKILTVSRYEKWFRAALLENAEIVHFLEKMVPHSSLHININDHRTAYLRVLLLPLDKGPNDTWNVGIADENLVGKMRT